jgi:hypothetical protein
MIEGIYVDVKGAELWALLQKTAREHLKACEYYLGLKSEYAEVVDSWRSCAMKQRCEAHVCSFMADHLSLDETYRVSWSELRSLAAGLLPAEAQPEAQRVAAKAAGVI